jgi:hypothetical protein
MTLGNTDRAGAVDGYHQDTARADSRTGFLAAGQCVRDLWGAVTS